MKLNVPYYSQFLDVDDKLWIPRACAIACLNMVLDYHGKDTSLTDLIKEGDSIGGYGPSGWYHDSLIELAKGFGLEASRIENVDFKAGIEDIRNSLEKNNPVIISAIKYILGQTKFHVVVITGFEEKDGNITGFYYHDPESVDRKKGQNIFVDIDIFELGWRKMAIFIHPKTFKNP